MTDIVSRFLVLEYLVKSLDTGIVSKLADRMNFAELWIKNVFTQYDEIAKEINIPFTFKADYKESQKVDEIINIGRELCRILYSECKRQNSMELTRIYIYIQEAIFILQEYKIELNKVSNN